MLDYPKTLYVHEDRLEHDNGTLQKYYAADTSPDRVLTSFERKPDYDIVGVYELVKMVRVSTDVKIEDVG